MFILDTVFEEFVGVEEEGSRSFTELTSTILADTIDDGVDDDAVLTLGENSEVDGVVDNLLVRSGKEGRAHLDGDEPFFTSLASLAEAILEVTSGTNTNGNLVSEDDGFLLANNNFFDVTDEGSRNGVEPFFTSSALGTSTISEVTFSTEDQSRRFRNRNGGDLFNDLDIDVWSDGDGATEDPFITSNALGLAINTVDVGGDGGDAEGFEGSEDLEGSDGLEHDLTRVEREGSDLGANFSVTEAILDLTRLEGDGFIVVFLVTLDGVLDDAVVVGR